MDIKDYSGDRRFYDLLSFFSSSIVLLAIDYCF